MPILGSHRPPAPYCEDCLDEDAQGTLLDTRASANVAVKRSKSTEFDTKSTTDKKNHEGSDSGYSSKAHTSDSMSTTSMKKGADLKIDMQPIERERHPYSYAPPRPEPTRTSPTKPKTVKMEKPPKSTPQRFQHPYGICWVCDQYGWHFDVEKEIPRPATTAPTPSQKIAKSPAPKARTKEEADSRPALAPRRASSTRRERPKTVYVSSGQYGFPSAPTPVDYSHPMLASNGWQAPNLMSQYSPYAQQYAPGTPVSANPYAQHPGFFDNHTMQYPHPNEPFYPQQYEGRDSHRHSKPPKQEAEPQRTVSRESRPKSMALKSKTQADRESMPPPPRPTQARPTMRRPTTEYPSVPSRRYSVITDDDDDDDDEDEELPVQALVAKVRQSAPKPPSAYKAPAGAEIYGRPRARKSSSYSTPSVTMQIASSSQREMPRRKTDPVEPKSSTEFDETSLKSNQQREANAEAYVARSRKQGEAELEDYLHRTRNRQSVDLDEYYGRVNSNRPPLGDLTQETLRRFEQKYPIAMSEAGSVQSQHSSSRDSATGRTRASTNMTSNTRMTNITMENGVVFSIPADCGDTPLHIRMGNLSFSVNANAEEEPTRELKRIERAPSVSSQTSRRSLTSGSQASAPKGQEDQQLVARQKQSANSSKRSSRAASSNRKDIPSIDYSVLDESYYFGMPGAL